MGVLAERGVTPGCLQLVVEIAGQVLHPDGGVLGEHALAFIQLLLQICQVELEVTDKFNSGCAELLKKHRKKEVNFSS